MGALRRRGKALEVHTNELLRTALREAPVAARRAKVADRTRILPDEGPLTLGQLAYVLGGERDLGDYLRATLVDGAWLTAEFAALLDAFVNEARNPAAHGSHIPRDVVLRWRDRLLGVGCEGVLVQLARVRRR